MQYVHDMHLRLHSGTTDAEAIPLPLLGIYTHIHTSSKIKEPLPSKKLEKKKGYYEQHVLIKALVVIRLRSQPN